MSTSSTKRWSSKVRAWGTHGLYPTRQSHKEYAIRLVTKLNDVRDDNTAYNNRLDTTLADVFSLLSLFYLTIGKTKDAPATYSQIASMRVSRQTL